MTRKAIPLKVQKKLLVLSGNKCCFPGCPERLYNLKEETYIGDFCHINAVKELGARHDETLLPEQIDSYDNLAIMCKNHHKIIDTNRSKYTAEVLREIKKAHELIHAGPTDDDETTGTSINLDTEREISEIETIFNKKENQEFLVKKNYPKVPNYIPRTYTSIFETEDLPNPYFLKDILAKHNRVTILAIAGTGKSIEIENLANQCANAEEEFFPVKIRLNLVTQQQPIIYFLRLEYPQLDLVPEEQRLILLDALDEVHSDHMDVVASNIALLGKELPKAKIVVSCRNNFYTAENAKRSATIEEFKTYFLNPLSPDDIRLYIHKNCTNENDFVEKVNVAKIYDLLYSPFYLVNLVMHYNKSHHIPNNKPAIFEYLIRERFEADADKYRNVGIKLRSNQNKIEVKLEELAFVAQCLSRNYLEGKEEFYKLVPNENLIEVLKRAYLFNTTQDDKWMFEHNNFQEYLAAKYLSKAEFSLIQDIVSFPDHKKIKPSWVNTLSFLFSILDAEGETFKNLLDWINQIEPDILIRFEKDKISPDVRESIFLKIYSNLGGRGIHIENEKFRGKDLAKFVSDSNKILNYLINEAKPDTNDVTLVDKTSFLLEFDNVANFKEPISQLLVAKICDPSVSDRTRYHCLTLLRILKISNKEITKTLLATNLFKSSKYFRAGFYNYILNSDEIEDHIKLYLEGIKHVRRLERVISGADDGEPNFFDEKYTLESVVLAINRTDNIIILLNFFNYYKGYSSFYNDLIKHLLTKAIVSYKAGANDLLLIVLQSLVSASKRHNRDTNPNYREFFIETSTNKVAFYELYKEFESGNEPPFETLNAISVITTEEIIDLLIKDAESRKLTDIQISNIKGILNYNNNVAFHNRFYEAIIKIDSKFKYEENVFEKYKVERAKRDAELLFDRDTFLTEMNNVFAKEGKNTLTSEELYDFRNDNFNNLNNDLVLQTIRRWAKAAGSISFKEITERISDDIKWLWFQLHTLINWDKHNKDFQFNAAQTDFLLKWVTECIKSVDFPAAIKTSEDERYHYMYTELFIVYLSERLEIEMSESTYLDFLYVDCELIPYKSGSDIKLEDRLISDFVLSKVDLDKVKARILENLKNPKIYRGVRYNYFRFFKKYKVKEGLEPVFNELTLKNLTVHERKELVELYLDLKGDLPRLESILDKVEEDLKIDILDRLVTYKSPNIETICVTGYTKAIGTDKELTYNNFLVHINSTKYFKHLKNWIIANRRIPEIGFEKFSEENYSELIELYEDCLKNNYGNEYWGNNKGVYLGQILELSSRKEPLYKQTSDTLQLWINTYPNSEYLHYHIQKLDQLYYSNLPQALSFYRIEAILSGNIKVKESKTIQFYNKHKKIIDIIMVVLGIVGFGLTIISLF